MLCAHILSASAVGAAHMCIGGGPGPANVYTFDVSEGTCRAPTWGPAGLSEGILPLFSSIQLIFNRTGTILVEVGILFSSFPPPSRSLKFENENWRKVRNIRGVQYKPCVIKYILWPLK